MSNLKISFIGGGNMPEALLSKALLTGVLNKDNTMVCDISLERLDYMKSNYDVGVTKSAKDAVEYADIVILAVKPQHFADAVKGIEENFKYKAIISIMAGVTSKQLTETFGKSCRILRVMPNTPALVGEGMSVLCKENTLSNAEMDFAEKFFTSVGKVEIVSEKLFDIVIGISGSGPAYVYMFIEALSDAGVFNGMPRKISYKLASQTVLGAAKMVLETNLHPGMLKDMVSSPGGTTIEAIASLENDGFRKAVINAVNKCTEKSKYLSRVKDEEN